MSSVKKVGKIIEWTVVVFAGGLILFMGAMIALPHSDYHLLIIRSGSMEPTIKTGSIVIVRRQATYAVGDVVTFHDKERDLVTHRIVRNDGDVYTTKGDANNTADMDAVPHSAVKGVVVLSLPYLGYVIAFLQTRTGVVLCVLVPALYVTISAILKIRKRAIRGSERKGE